MIYILTVQMVLRGEETISLTGRRTIRRILTPLEINNKNYIYRSLTAFTFIELFLVIILLGVVAVLSTPNFRNTYYNFLLSDTSHNLTYLMRYAQARSIAERTNYRLNFDPQRSKYWLTKESDDEDGRFVSLKGKLGKIYNINDNLQLECDLEFINFYPDGRIDKANIFLSNKKDKFFTISTEAQSGYVQEFDYKK